MKRILIAATLLLLIWTTSAVAQGITPTDPPSPTPSSTPLPTITLTLFRDADSLTLLVPASSLRVSLVGLEYRVTLLDGQTIIRRLDRDFAAFVGLPFDQISVIGAACFRLVKAGTIGPVPIECTNGPMRLTQQLAAADGFWHDPGIGVGRVVILMQDGAFVGLCPAEQSTCAFSLTLRPVTQTPIHSATANTAGESVVPTLTPSSKPIQATATPTPSYPCEATIVSTGTSSVLNVVRRFPSLDSPVVKSVNRGMVIEIINRSEDRLWYRIADIDGRSLGWILPEYLSLSGSCPG